MQTLELIGVVDEQLQLHASLPSDATPGTVQVWVKWPEAATNSDAGLLSDWKLASHAALQEIWDNDEDAVYDELPAR